MKSIGFREKCLEQGPQVLSLEECLAVILGVGPPGEGGGVVNLARAILGSAVVERDDADLFERMTVTPWLELNKIRGLGQAQQARLMAVFEICRRYAAFRISRNAVAPTAIHEDDFKKLSVLKIPQNYRSHAQEWLGFVPLLADQKFGAFVIVEKGARTHLNVDPVELFARILAYRPRGLVLVHNHPSGNCTPSAADVDLTLRVKEVADSLGIQLLGHVIVSSCEAKWIQV